MKYVFNWDEKLLRVITLEHAMSKIKLRDNVFERAIRVLREEGVRSFWFKLLGELGYRRLLLLERPLGEPIPDVKPRVPVTIDLLEKTEVDKYLAFRTDADPSIVEGWFNAGNRCVVARHEGQIISASWAAVDRAWSFYLACEIRLAQHEVYVYDAFTRPDFRGQSVLPAMRAEVMRHLRATGYQRIICGIQPENKSILRAVGKVGFRPFGMMSYIKIGPWRRDFYKNINEGGHSNEQI